MNEKGSEKEIHSPTDKDAISASPDSVTQSETPNRRELIGRYAKYAVVAAPLLVFVSKARAIHSKP
jgi:hypothetical protein